MANKGSATVDRRIAVAGLVIALLGLPALLIGYFQILKPLVDQRPIAAVSCHRYFDKAHGKLRSSVAAPPVPGITFTPSPEISGRVDASLAWINSVPIDQSVVAMSGVYGTRDSEDDFIDQHEPSAAPGGCWDWYHFGPRDDAQPNTVRTTVEGLWPGQRYCFYGAYRVHRGYSQPSAISCVTAPWKKAWGIPSRAEK